MKEMSRKLSAGRIAAVVLVLLLGVFAAPVCRASAAETYSVQVTGRMLRSESQKFLDLINAERDKAGVPAMQFDEKAMHIAEVRAAQNTFEMVISHTLKGEDIRQMDSFDGITLFPGTFRYDLPLGIFEDGTPIDEPAEMFFDHYNNEQDYKISEEESAKDAFLDEENVRVGIAFFQSGTKKNRGYHADLCIMRETEEEPLVPYTGDFSDENMTFAFEAADDAIEFKQGQKPKMLNIGESDRLRPAYCGIYFDYDSDSFTVSDQYNYLDSDCGTWVSSDPDVVTADPEDGTVTGISAGTAEVYFLLNGDEAKKYTRTVEALPGKAKITSLKSPGSKKLKVIYEKVDGADGYRVHVSTSPNFSTKKILTTKKLKLTTNVQKSNSYYYVKVRAFYLDNAGNRVFGKFSKVRKVRVK